MKSYNGSGFRAEQIGDKVYVEFLGQDGYESGLDTDPFDERDLDVLSDLLLQSGSEDAQTRL